MEHGFGKILLEDKMELKITYSKFVDKNLPDLLITVGEWIANNEINVSDILVFFENDMDDYCIGVYYYEASK